MTEHKGHASHASDLAMKGEGYYSLATKGAKDVIDGATPLVMAAIERMAPGARSGPFTLADMGCADGGTSLDMVGAALTRVRELAPDRPLVVVYSDQLMNDYNALFRIVHGASELHEGLPALEGLSVFASATSFYRRILPPGTLDLGFSATAMHWLSRKPCEISDHVQAVGAQGEELVAFAEQGRKDWETILLARARELAPGGRLVLVNFCRDEQGRYLGHTDGINMFETFNDLWRAMLEEGAITASEFRAMSLPQYYKDVEEFSAPLTDPTSPVHKAGLRLESIETRIVRCPYAAAFKDHGDAALFAKSYIPTLRSWTESTFFKALSERRPLEERRALIERYYDTYEAMVREAPHGHAMDYVHAYMTIVKDARS